MIPNFKVSRFFWFYELIKSDTHPELSEQNSLECVPFLYDLTAFSREVLDIAREALGGPTIVSSGFRGETTLNPAVGGLATSKHRLGIACDIVQAGWDWDQCLDAAHVICAYFEERGICADVVAEKRADGKVWIHIERNATLRLFTGINKEYVEQTF
jgi:hypothetical protein